MPLVDNVIKCFKVVNTQLEKIDRLQFKIKKLHERIKQLEKGEFICKKCGIRKAADPIDVYVQDW